ncbi:MAG TPA: HAD-IA family hydrolase [Anaerolineae bacterium]|nr:HAD-IA family hydrolase [Anaerolineae bacterium]
MAISTIIFDVGGVIVRTVDPTPRQQWEAKLGLNPGQLEYLFFNSPGGHAAQRGERTTTEQWAWVGQQLNLNQSDLQQLSVDFWAGDEVDPNVVNLFRQLHGPYQTAIISNAMDNLHQALADWGITNDFDLIVSSADEGIMKPDATIFKNTIKRLNCQPNEAVFIDDFKHNIDGAHAVGLHGIHYTPTTNLSAELEKLGVNL